MHNNPAYISSKKFFCLLCSPLFVYCFSCMH